MNIYAWDAVLAAARDNPGKWVTTDEVYSASVANTIGAQARTGIRIKTRRLPDGRLAVSAIPHDCQPGKASFRPVFVDIDAVEPGRGKEHLDVLDRLMQEGFVVVTGIQPYPFILRLRSAARRRGIKVIVRDLRDGRIVIINGSMADRVPGAGIL